MTEIVTMNRPMPKMIETARGEKIPKNAFDREYSTQWKREVVWLLEHGIDFTFVKERPVRGLDNFSIKTYKYKKTPALFRKLQEFYQMIEDERAAKAAELATETETQESDPDAEYTA